MNLAILNLGFDPVALMRRAKSQGIARPAKSLAPWSDKERSAKSATRARSTVLGGTRLERGSGKARVLGLALDELLPVTDPIERNKWQVLANSHGVHLTRVAGGLKRVAEKVQATTTEGQRAPWMRSATAGVR